MGRMKELWADMAEKKEREMVMDEEIVRGALIERIEAYKEFTDCDDVFAAFMLDYLEENIDGLSSFVTARYFAKE